MISKLLELVTGKDDVERAAAKDDLIHLDTLLKTRRLLVPKRPRKYLDASNFTQDELLKLIEFESQELAGDQLELWVLDLDGKKHLPVFSSQEKLHAFTQKMLKETNKVFAVGCIDALAADVVKQTGVDFLNLNLYSSERSWTLDVRKLSS